MAAPSVLSRLDGCCRNYRPVQMTQLAAPELALPRALTVVSLALRAPTWTSMQALKRSGQHRASVLPPAPAADCAVERTVLARTRRPVSADAQKTAAACTTPVAATQCARSPRSRRLPRWPAWTTLMPAAALCQAPASLESDLVRSVTGSHPREDATTTPRAAPASVRQPRQQVSLLTLASVVAAQLLQACSWQRQRSSR